MRIRPHHALCAQFFVGKGYSEAFVAHMYQVLAELDREGALVTLTDACDDICTACPNRRDGRCETEEKVAAIDGRALRAMGLKVGDTLPWRELRAAAQRRIILPGALGEVCADCEWISLCLGLLRETKGVEPE